ncbi:MAG: ATP-dependent metallopeptidase FtsH/Yme1/Tma family protein, partial [Bacteroidales bacterium]
MNENKNSNTNKNKPDGPQKPKLGGYWIYILIAVAFLSLQFFNFGGSVDEVGQVKLEQFIRDGSVSKIVVVNKEYAEIYLVPEAKTAEQSDDRGINSLSQTQPDYIYNFLSPDEFSKWRYELEKEIGSENFPEYTTTTRNNYFADILSWVIPIILLVAIWMFIFRRMSGGAGGGAGNIFSVGKSKAQIFDKNTHVKIDFKDVAGLEEAKLEVKEIVDFLKNPKKYTDLG